MPQHLSPASRQTQAHGYKNICIKRGTGTLGTVPRVKGFVPETHVLPRASLIKNRKQEWGGGCVQRREKLGRAEGGRQGPGSLGAPSRFSQGRPTFCPALPALRPTGPWTTGIYPQQLLGLCPGGQPG